MREDSSMRLSAIAFIITLALVILVAPLAAETLPSAKVARIGYLGGQTTREQEVYMETFLEGMRALGYVEGQNLILEYRGAAG
jgi:putative tryptophan/tyrosine transport system substrate-binding protein